MNNKKRLALMAVALTMIASSSAVVLTTSGCGGTSNNNTPTQIEYQTLTGSYYSDANGSENQITFTGSSFSTTLSGVSATGSYTYDGDTVTLSYSDGKTVTAKFEDGNLNLTSDNANYSLMPKTTYEVTYNLDGGTGTTSAEVVNGRTATKPANPGKVGYTFVGWYADSQFNTVYSFDTAITANTTIYARFIKNLDSEYTLDFNLGYDGGTLDSVSTVGGYAYNLPVPERTGYTFVGWWESDYGSADKLTAQVENGQKISASTTLYAVWAGNTPAVSVTATGISWTSVGVNKTYRVVIAAPDGTEEVKSVAYTNYSYDFASKDPGDYVIQVLVNGSSTYAYYRNKGLAKVSIFKVEGNVLAFNQVDNAQKYILSYACGTAGHDHKSIDLGEQTSYDFSDCDMVKGGLNFTVTAVAEGYAQSVSEVYNVNKTLAAVTGLTVDATTDIVKWDAVEGATYYKVEITKGDKSETFNVSDKTTYDLTSYYGEYTLSVTAVAHGYNSADATTLTYNKTRLTTPANFRLSNDAIVWDEVEGAKAYKVTINNKVYTVTSASVPVTDEYFDAGIIEFEVSVQAIAEDSANNSIVTDTLTIRRASMSDNLKYANGVVSWEPVIGVDKYGVKLNDGQEIYVDSDKTSYGITFTADGYNTISVRCYDGTNASEWVDITVYVNKITFNANGGTVVSSQLVATGDDYSLPTSTRTGYTLLGWFTSMTNGTKVDDSLPYNSGDKTYYAHWDKNTYNITLSVAETEGSLGDQSATVAVKYTDSYTLPVPTSADGTKLFYGWYNGDNAYTDAQGVCKSNWNDVNDVTLTPRWLEAFKYELISLNNQQVYAVSKADGITEFKEVTVPATYNGVKVGLIENECFKYCSNLEVINIPDSIEYITIGDEGNNTAGSAFYKCSSLKVVNIYHVEGNNDIKYSSTNGMLIYNNPKSGAVELKFVPSKLTGELVIPDGVTSLSSCVLQLSDITAVRIPASVTYIGRKAFASCHNLRTVTFLSATDGEEQALTIDENAFWYCDAITSIVLPARLAFTEATNKSGETVSLFSSIFEDCSALRYVDIERGQNATFTSVDGIVYKDNGSTLYYVPKGVGGSYRVSSRVVTIGKNAFENCNLLTEVVIPGNVSLIDSYAFKNCSALANVVFEGDKNSPALTIKTNAFYNLASLTSVVLPENLKVLETKAFATANLTTVTVNNVLTDISYASNAFVKGSTTTPVVKNLTLGENATAFEFAKVFGSSLENVYLDENNKNYASVDGVLYDVGITTILYVPDAKAEYVMPESISVIGANVFKDKTGLTKVTLGKNVTSIGDWAFGSCTGLTTVTFAEGRGNTSLTIGDNVFNGCSKLTSISLPEGLTSIGDYVFKGTKLVNIVIPEGVTTLGHYVFQNVTTLKTVSLPSTLTSAGEYGTLDSVAVFGFTYTDSETSAKIYNLSYSSTAAETLKYGGIDIFEGCTELTTLTAQSGEGKYAAENNVLYKKDDQGNLAVLDFSPQKNAFNNGVFVVPASVTRISDRAFYKNKSLKSVTFEDDDDVEMGNYIFYECTLLESITLPSNLSTISQGMFYSTDRRQNNNSLTAANKLTTITIPATVTYIGVDAFRDCFNLTSIEFATSEEKPALVIGDGYETSTANGQGSPSRNFHGAFVGCTGLTSIAFPERTTVIGKYCFYVYSYTNGGTSSKKYDGLLTLQTVSLPSTLTNINYKAFSNDNDKKNISVSTVTFNDGDGDAKVEIGKSAFWYTNVKNLTLSNKVKTIGELAFYYTKLTSLQIPENVESIGKQAFYSNTSLTQVTFVKDAKITTIENNAFSGCSLLDSINLEDCKSLTTLGYGAFKNCKVLTSVTLPESIQEIGEQAFSGCSALSTITFNTVDDENGVARSNIAKIDDSAFTSTALAEIDFPESTASEIKLGDSLFSSIDTLNTVKLSYSVKDLGGAFNDCGSSPNIIIPEKHSTLKAENGLILGLNINGETVSINFANVSVKTNNGAYSIPSGITYIGIGAFMNQTEIVELTIPASVRTIDDNAFKGCTGLKNIIFDGTSQLTSVGNSAFEGCTSLTSITLPDGVVSLGVKAFMTCTSLKTAELPETINTIGAYVFSGCTALETANVPAVYTKSMMVGTVSYSPLDYMFEKCTNLKNITLSDDLTFLGEFMFTGCTALKSIELSENVTWIGHKAFEKCTSLESAAIYGKLVLSYSSDYGTFDGCTRLKTVILNDAIETIGNYMFGSCSALKTIKTYNSATKEIKGEDNEVTLPSSLTELGQYTFRSSGIEKITIPYGVTQFRVGTSSASTGSSFYECTSLKTVILHDEFTSIGGYAFKGCTALKTIQYMSNGELVGNVNEVTLPSSLTSIGDHAFGSYRRTSAVSTSYKGSGIEKLILPDNGSLTLGTYVFQDCTSLKEVYVGNSVKILGNSTTSYMFDNCTSLRKVVLNDQLTSIGGYVFKGCTALKTVQYMSNGELVGDENVATFPVSITSIGQYAFGSGRSATTAYKTTYKATGIEKLILPDGGNLTLGLGAFGDNLSLREVVIGNSVKALAISTSVTTSTTSGLFANCTNLEKVILNDKITGIGKNTFIGCGKLKTIGYTTSDGEEVVTENVAQLPDSITILSESAFSSGRGTGSSMTFTGAGIENLILPASITSLGKYVFQDCKSLQTIQNNGTLFGDYMFDACSALESVLISKETTNLATYTFRNCTSLTTVKYYDSDADLIFGNNNEVTLPTGLVSVGQSVFEGCSAITKVVFKGEATSIGSAAFKNCTSLTTINVTDSTTVNSTAFTGCTSLNKDE